MDLQETPAVPPMDPGGDARLGYFLAGGILITLGWVFGVLVNLLLHHLAASGTVAVLGHTFGSTLGPYAWAVLGFGLVTGAFGVVLLALGRASPKANLVLPGYDY